MIVNIKKYEWIIFYHKNTVTFDSNYLYKYRLITRDDSKNQMTQID